MDKKILVAETPILGHKPVFCPYCRKKLFYLWDSKVSMYGANGDKWLYCDKCHNTFKKARNIFELNKLTSVRIIKAGDLDERV